MKKLSLFLLLILILTLTACARRTAGPLAEDAPPDNVPSIVGEYAINGFDPDGNEYGGRLNVILQDNGEYLLQWIISDSLQEGTGTLTGNQLTVTWRTVEGFLVELTGTATYTVTVKGELYGYKFIDGKDGEGTEAAYPNSGDNMSK
ncbi:MAG: hypothetical protein HUU38_11175 [Anaerolineales bacterium]|nr:hypothetical protein [Anaerolineales bacterium]